jgi:hypothetical protein
VGSPLGGGPHVGSPLGGGPLGGGPLGGGPQTATPGQAFRGGYNRGVPPLRDRPRAPSQAEGLGTAGGQLIRQRDTAIPEGGGPDSAQPVAAIAPDGLDSFARDLRALRAKAELDYPEMAERSHYTMKTLASAAGGLRLPTLPVAMAYVRACGGEQADWEDRWHKLAEKVTADAAKKQQGDGAEPLEPAEASAVPEPPQPPPSSAADAGEVYIITSAKPRQPGWLRPLPGGLTQ